MRAAGLWPAAPCVGERASGQRREVACLQCELIAELSRDRFAEFVTGWLTGVREEVFPDLGLCPRGGTGLVRTPSQ